jgi:hypothetical protein
VAREQHRERQLTDKMRDQITQLASSVDTLSTSVKKISDQMSGSNGGSGGGGAGEVTRELAAIRQQLDNLQGLAGEQRLDGSTLTTNPLAARLASTPP